MMGRPISASKGTRTTAPIRIAGNRPPRIALRTVETEIDLAAAYSATETCVGCAMYRLAFCTEDHLALAWGC
jgi:hypothetical protein